MPLFPVPTTMGRGLQRQGQGGDEGPQDDEMSEQGGGGRSDPSNSNSSQSSGLSNGKVQTEVACALSWFSNWSHDQRKVFTDKLFSGLNLEDAAEQLLQDLDKMSIDGGGRRECPSVFECQLRIFDGWFRAWSESDKMEFINQICMRNDL